MPARDLKTLTQESHIIGWKNPVHHEKSAGQYFSGEEEVVDIGSGVLKTTAALTASQYWTKIHGVPTNTHRKLRDNLTQKQPTFLHSNLFDMLVETLLQ